MMYSFQQILFSSNMEKLLTITHNDCYSPLDWCLSGGDIDLELLPEYVGVFKYFLLWEEEALAAFLSYKIKK